MGRSIDSFPQTVSFEVAGEGIMTKKVMPFRDSRLVKVYGVQRNTITINPCPFSPIPQSGYSMLNLDTRCSILDTRCSILDTRYSILDARCWMLFVLFLGMVLLGNRGIYLLLQLILVIPS